MIRNHSELNSFTDMVYHDNFSNPNSGWPTIIDEGSSIAYQFEGLRFLINNPNYDYWSAPANSYKDVRVSVVSSKLGGPDDNEYGIICRLNDKNNYYGFLIGSDGYAGIVKVKGGDVSLLTSDEMQFFEVIRLGEARNDLEAVCTGPRLTFSINGEFVLETEDDEYPSGRAGLMISSRNFAGVDIFFDDFTVRNP